MPNTALPDSIARQFANVHKMLWEAVKNCPPEEWRAGRHAFFIPARLAFHVVQATDFHLDADGKSFNWSRFGFDWEEAAPDALPGQEQLLEYLGEVEAKVARRLGELGQDGLLGADYAGFFPTALDHVLYTLRHVQHHVGQINAELKTRGHKPARWR